LTLTGLSRSERFLLGAVVVAVAAAGVTRYVAGVSNVLAFVVATVALAGTAWVVSFSVDQVGRRLGPGPTGLMQASLANLPEFFVVIFALNGGHLIVAQTAIVGSVLVNALLVLGLVIVAGARRAGRGGKGVMRFSPRLPNDTATLLLVATFIIVLAALTHTAHDAASHHIKTISIISACAILVVYGAWLNQYLRSKPGSRPADETPPRVAMRVSLGLLTAAGVASAFVSDWFVHALEPTIHTLGISQQFAGLVIVAIAGNAVENITGLVLAYKGRSDLAISVVKNSVAQIAAFLFPLLVLVSLLLATTLTFALAPVYIGALVLTTLVLWQVTGDGEAAEFEGWALVALYVILATLTIYE